MVRRADPAGLLGLILPTFPQDAEPAWARGPASGGPANGGSDPEPDSIRGLLATCRRAEQLGADALWTCDHLFWHGPSLESMMVLAMAATATSHAALGTCVMQLPLRHAPVVAKQAATLQSLTGGRFVLGVGVGSHEGEYQQAAIDYRRRGQLLDAAITELRRSWATGGKPGDHDHPPTYRQLPEPPPVPVWVGGSSEAALRRAAALADGWMPLFLTPDTYQQALERLEKEVQRAGRPEGAVTPAMTLFVSVDDDPALARTRGTRWMSSLYAIPAKAFDRHLVAGSPAEVAAVVTAFRRAGAQHVSLYVTDDDPLPQFELLASAVSAADAAYCSPVGS
jgi:alkanesulfonate monooxygenase SsuD/methylene tetrahydromethanopterin reductase-like flavin-dependent oxidoreductase (luciferase family)